MAVFKCDSCGYEREVPEKLSGKKAKCPDCGQGVTIVDALPLHDDPDASFEQDDHHIDDVNDSAEDVKRDAYDLDSVDGEVDFGGEDVVCECGNVLLGGEQVCPECGAEIRSAQELPDPFDTDIDVSDLAEDDEPQVWDADYGEDSERSEFSVDEDESASSRGLFEGNPVLNIASGLVSGVLALFFAVALSLLATGQESLHDFLPFVLATTLTGMTVATLVFSFQSRIPFALAGPETILAALFFLLLGEVYGSMEGSFANNEIVATLLATIALVSLIAGLMLWITGKIKSAEYVRFIPIQIIGGVIGGIGVYVLFGTLDWIGPLAVDWNNLPLAVSQSLVKMNSMETIYTMGPSIVFGVILFIGLRKVKNSLLLLVVLLVSAIAGYAAGIWGTDASIRSLAETLPHLDGGIPLFPVHSLVLDFDAVQWVIIKDNSLYFGGVLVLMFLTNMMRVTGLEMVQGRESDLNEEFRSLGLTNMVTGLAGGMVANISYGRSAGAAAVGAQGPISGIVAGLVCAAGTFFINDLIPFIPRFVPEGLLIFSGFTLIRDWVFRSRTAFTRRSDLRMLWLTFFVTVAGGVLLGIGFGVAMAFLVTVSRTSRGGAVRNVLSGANHNSNVDRAPAQQRTLKEFGDHIHIIRLQGFLSLGAMTGLLKQIQTRLDNRDRLPVEYLLLDFKLVSGIASSAGIGFDKMRHMVDEYDIELLITSAPLELEEHLEKGGHVGGEEGAFKVFFNLDYALEWCENHVLNAENMLEMKQLTLPELLAPVFPEPKYIPALMKVLKRVRFNKGEAVFRQGDRSDAMYFVESGKLDVELELEGGKILRLKKIGAGAVFGEMGIYTMAPRSATIRAAEKCVVYMMTTEKLDAVEKRAPMLVTAVNRYLINLLSERLGDANAKVRDLMA